MRYLIADSGSTKADWVLVGMNGIEGRYKTEGINPFHQSEDEIADILHHCLLPQLPPLDELNVFFYGSGVRPELEPLMECQLRSAFPSALVVEAHGDLLGAARAVCGRAEGIACILGTGSNSGLYDGRRIVQNTPALGYILGDEGSGAVLGQRFVNALYKGFVPTSVLTDFEAETGLSMSDIIARVYRQPLANRFLASLSPFIWRHLEVPQMCQLVVDNFRDFFRRNIMQYHRSDLPVGFVGSIAFHYQELLLEAATAEGFLVGRVLKSPVDGLVDYYEAAK